MKVTVVNGTQKHGVTYHLTQAFLEPLRDHAEIVEFYLPRDCAAPCIGCTTCFLKDEHQCKDASEVQRIHDALIEADLLMFTSPTYVFHTTGAMKSFLDHLGYRWMPHRPAPEMFGKRAVIITQALGMGQKGAAKDIRHSLSWWGISSIRTISFALRAEITWDKIPQAQRDKMIAKLQAAARRALVDSAKGPARTSIATKVKFLAVRSMQTQLGKDDPEYRDFQHWRDLGWIGKERPWKRGRA